jgi:hypothetical protein
VANDAQFPFAGGGVDLGQILRHQTSTGGGIIPVEPPFSLQGGFN